MRTIEVNLYQFDELSDKAKERARQWYREASAGDSSWADCIIEDAAQIAAMLGIELKQRAIPLMRGGTRQEPAIYWTGFCCQGDGACFEGTYSYQSNAVDSVIAHAPKDSALPRIAAELEAAQSKYDGKITATIEHSRSGGNYYHAQTMTFDFELDEDSRRDIDDETAEAMREAFRDFADWIYDALRKEDEFQNSDETVDENIRANEYEFLQSGKRA